MKKPAVVAIDGPVAAGKTAVGRLFAQQLSFRFLDTGLMYRAITWLALHRGIDLEDAPSLTRLAKTNRLDFHLKEADSLWMDGQKLGLELRSLAVEQAVSRVAIVKGVRTELVRQQRVYAKSGDIVVVGRDIGTVVLPLASLKVFLSASVSERASRRYSELKRLGRTVQYAEVLHGLKARDQLDSERSLSPLCPAADARVLNTDGLSVAAVADWMREMFVEGESLGHSV